MAKQISTIRREPRATTPGVKFCRNMKQIIKTEIYSKFSDTSLSK